MAANVCAVVAAKAAASHMGEGGRIITIGSANADCMSFVGGSVHAMTKPGLTGRTRGLARDLAA